MNALRVLDRTLAILFILSIPVLLIASNVRFAANSQRLYEYSFDHYNVERRTGMARPELDRAAADLIDYFNNGQHAISTVVTIGGQQAPLYNERETLHLIDVKTLFRLVFHVQEGAIAFALVYIVALLVRLRSAALPKLASEVIKGAALTVAIILGLGFLAVTGFDSAFTKFHELAFSNDFWQLDPRTDRLIQMFPEGFWQDVTLFIGVLSIVEAGILIVPAYVYLRLSREAAAHPEPTETASHSDG
jgi:integral membrane protein (TIGR01906 family)